MSGQAFAERLASVLERMEKAAARAGRAVSEVRLVAVSKFHPAQSVEEAAYCGQFVFGENYVQEALAKQKELDGLPNLEWHFIGHVQLNKAKDVCGRFALVHTVDDLRLAEAFNRRLPESKTEQNVLIQVNIGHEEQKSGVSEEALLPLAEGILALPRVRLLGLMGMPPVLDGGEAARPYFARLRELRDDLAQKLGVPLPELSMGMSGDFEQAIEEGASLIRVGTTLFGPRPAQKP